MKRSGIRETPQTPDSGPAGLHPGYKKTSSNYVTLNNNGFFKKGLINPEFVIPAAFVKLVSAQAGTGIQKSYDSPISRKP
jgi:hypothetical protein